MVAFSILQDAAVSSGLGEAGWTVLRIWEHELKPASEADWVRMLEQVLAEGLEARGD